MRLRVYNKNIEWIVKRKKERSPMRRTKGGIMYIYMIFNGPRRLHEDFLGYTKDNPEDDVYQVYLLQKDEPLVEFFERRLN